MSTYDPTEIELAVDPLTERFAGIAMHGNTPFDVPWISHITDNLYVGGCAPNLYLPRNIEHVVSLYPWGRYQVKHDLRSEMYVQMYDSDGEVDSVQVAGIATWAALCITKGPTLIHCQAGLNRSNLIAATALTLLGHDIDDAIALLRERRSPAVLCNKTFEAWLRKEL